MVVSGPHRICHPETHGPNSLQGSRRGTQPVVVWLALSRLGSIDVIWIGRDGSVNGESLAGMVNQYNIAGPGSAWGSSIAAVSRGQNKLDVWWIGPLGQSEREKLPHEQSGYVYWNSWDWGDTHPSDRYDMPWRGKYQLPQSKAAIRGGLAAVARDSNNMDVWWIGVDGSVNGKTWISGNWQPDIQPS